MADIFEGDETLIRELEAEDIRRIEADNPAEQPLPEATTDDTKKEKDVFKPPPAKKACVATTSRAEDTQKPKLETRLGGILCCAVCLDLPRTSVFQCSNGHLMCAGCFNHLLADARIRDESANCPNCRVELSSSVGTRNLAVEKAVSELPAECSHCLQDLPRNLLPHHEANLCPDRPSVCQYSLIGCKWEGPHHSAEAHHLECPQPALPASQIMLHLLKEADAGVKEKTNFTSFMSLLSLEKITFNDVQMRPYRTEELSSLLYYETTRFSAFGCVFRVNMRLNDDRRHAHLTNTRHLSYQLVLRGKPPCPRLVVHYSIVRGPFGGMRVLPHIAQHEFTEAATETPWTPLPLVDSTECNRLLATRSIDFRIIMGQQPVSVL